ncbi:MAG: hypothetical protein HZB38_03785 [Planctomycetes bacterium]|nr:hypothetical protein [Planctomycetota bacterium]
MMTSVRRFPLALRAAVMLLAGTVAASAVLAQSHNAKPAAGANQVTTVFKGAKVNGGTVTHEHKDGRHVLTLSDDFKTPDTPAPHWQVVDSKGNVYLLNRLMVKGGLLGGDKLNKTITLPSYIEDVAKVQIWCAWAEVLLGEAPFDAPVK